MVPTAGVPRADDHVGLAGEERLEDPAELARVVLAVPVDLDGDVEAVGQRVAEARLHRAADPEVERQSQEQRSGGLRNGSGTVV